MLLCSMCVWDNNMAGKSGDRVSAAESQIKYKYRRYLIIYFVKRDTYEQVKGQQQQTLTSIL